MEAVRRAQPADLSRCAELLSAAWKETAEQRGGARLLADGRAGSAEATLAAWSSGDDDHVLFAGTFCDVVVGIGAGHVVSPAPAPLPGGPGATAVVGVVDCCYVEPPARQVGVGTALLTELVRWCVERGCTGLDALALPGDRATKQLLEEAGFSARLLVLHRRLP